MKTFYFPESGIVENGLIHLGASGSTINFVIPLGSKLHTKDLVFETDYPNKKVSSNATTYNPAEEISSKLEFNKPGMYYVQFKSKDIESSKLSILIDPVIQINNKQLSINDIKIQAIKLDEYKELSNLKQKIADIAKNGYNVVQFITKEDNDILNYQIQLPEEHTDAPANPAPVKVEKAKPAKAAAKVDKAVDKTAKADAKPAAAAASPKETSTKAKDAKTSDAATNGDKEAKIASKSTKAEKVDITEEVKPAEEEEVVEEEPEIAPEVVKPPPKLVKLIDLIPDLEKEFNIGFMNDVHLKKVTNDMDWVLSHPQFTLNDVSAPWLQKAVELDQTIYEISHSIDRSMINDVNATKGLLVGKLQSQKLKDEFTINIDKVLEEYSLYDIKKLPMALKENITKFEDASLDAKIEAIRNNAIKGTKVDVEYIVSVFGAADFQSNSELMIALSRINEPLQARFREICEEICFNEASFLRNHQNVTARRLFAEKEVDGKVIHIAYDGFVPGYDDPLANKGDYTNVYFTRKIICNEGVLKLHNTHSKEHNPDLWGYIESTFSEIAKVSQIIRLVDITSIDETLLELSVNYVRNIKPNILITSQIDPQVIEAKGISILTRYNLNALVRDCGSNSDSYEVSHIIWQAGGCDIGSISRERNIIKLTEQVPLLLFDALPETNIQDLHILPVLASITMSLSPIGSAVTRFNYPEIVSALNLLHTELSQASCETEFHAYGGILTILRMNSNTGEGFWMITRFRYSDDTPKKIPVPADVLNLRFEALKSDHVHFNTKKADFVEIYDGRMDVEKLPLGAVIVYETEYSNSTTELIKKLNNGVFETAIDQQLKDLTLTDLNNLMFRGEGEDGGYNVEGISISGIEGILRLYEDNENAIYKHIKSGDWLLDYTVQRLFRSSNLISLSQYLRVELAPFKKLQPRSILPKYFYKLMKIISDSFNRSLSSRLSKFATNNDHFIAELTKLSVSLYGNSGEKRYLANRATDQCLFGPKTLLKEVLVAIRGNLMVTGRYEDAKRELTLLAQKSLDSGNASIALLFPQALQDYFLIAPDGYNILTEKCEHGRTFLYYVLQIIERYGQIETIKSKALLASTLRWLDHCSNKDIFIEKSVCGKTFAEWHNEIEKSFDAAYYNEEGGYSGTIVDVLLSISVAPEIFDSIHAVKYINGVSSKLESLSENIIPTTVAFLIRASATMKRRLSPADLESIGLAKNTLRHLKVYGVSPLAVGALLDGFYEYQKLSDHDFIDWKQYIDE